MASFLNSKPLQSIPKSVHNMDYSMKGTCDMGWLVPIYDQEVYPNERIQHELSFMIKSLPMSIDLIHDINIYFHFWWVPNRLVHNRETMATYDAAKFPEGCGDNNTFEDYITGVDEDNNIMPTFFKSGSPQFKYITDENTSEIKKAYQALPISKDASLPNKIYLDNSILDYLNILPVDSITIGTDGIPASIEIYSVRAVNKIYNEYYRDENLQDPVHLNQINIKRRNWEKDLYTSALPWPQKGTPIAIPITATTRITSALPIGITGSGVSAELEIYGSTVDNPIDIDHGSKESINMGFKNSTTTDMESIATQKVAVLPTEAGLTTISGGFDVATLRLNSSIQRMLEMNAQGGTKFHEFLMAQFGTAPADEELQKPVYLGGIRKPLIIDTITQTSESGTTPQGYKTSNGFAASSGFTFNRMFKEHGHVIGLMSIMPKPSYSQGIDKQYIKNDVYEWYNPVFANLGELPVQNMEIFYQKQNTSQASDENEATFGYTPSWQYMRGRQDIVTSGFRKGKTFEHYTLSRTFSDLPELNSAFIVCNPDKTAFVDQNEDEFYFSIFHKVSMSRIVPYEMSPKII